jgi:hypothetical protein
LARVPSAQSPRALVIVGALLVVTGLIRYWGSQTRS